MLYPHLSQGKDGAGQELTPSKARFYSGSVVYEGVPGSGSCGMKHTGSPCPVLSPADQRCESHRPQQEQQ